LTPIARRAASRQRLRADRVSPFTFRVADAREATLGPHCHYVPARVTFATGFGLLLPPVRLTRRDTGRRSQINVGFQRVAVIGAP
jgi:hypothetical protein